MTGPFGESRVYGHRESSLYGEQPTDSRLALNPHILAWWTGEHDRLVARLIERERWLWDWSATQEVVAITPEDALAHWKATDPKVHREGGRDDEFEREGYAWYNVIMYFAKSRAETLGLTDAIRPAGWKTCPICAHRFREDSLWVPVALVYGVANVTHCSPCLEEAVHGEGDREAPAEEVLSFARDLSAILNRPGGRRPTQRQVWPQSFRLVSETGDLPTRVRYVEALHRKPALARVRELFGSWRAACDRAAGNEPPGGA